MPDVRSEPRRSLVDLAVSAMRERLERGEWRVGERIPIEPELAAELLSLIHI